MTAAPQILRDDPAGDGILLNLKAVPGASRDQIAGPLGDRLKVRVAAPPEDGKANTAICEILASALGVAPRSVEIVSGHTRAEKTARVRGIAVRDASAKLGI